jgi:vacuolar protein sorting-associated protein 26
VRVTPLTGKPLEHAGIKVQLLGQIELATERGHPHAFVSLVRELAPPGVLSNVGTYPFEFRNVEMQYDSYRGNQVWVVPLRQPTYRNPIRPRLSDIRNPN